MQVVTTPSFNKDISDISKIKDRTLARRIEKVIEMMLAAPNITSVTGVKKLEGSTNAYRIRIADYRLGFFLEGKTIRLAVFAHRKDIYRHFP